MTYEYGTAEYHHAQILDWEDILSGWHRHLRSDLRKGDAAEIARCAEHIANAASILKEHANKLAALTPTTNETAA